MYKRCKKLEFRLFVFLGICAFCLLLIPSVIAQPRVEIYVSYVDRQIVEDEIVNFMLDRDYYTTSETKTNLVFDRPIKNIMGAVLFGSRYDSQPNVRVRYSIRNSFNRIRVIANIMVVTNPGSAFERITPIENADALSNYRTMLNELKRRLEIRATPTHTGKAGAQSEVDIKNQHQPTQNRKNEVVKCRIGTQVPIKITRLMCKREVVPENRTVC